MFCKQCGDLIEDDAKFCAKCGEAIDTKLPASVGQRFANYAIDYFIILLLTILVGVFSSESAGGTILVIFMTSLYYLIFESIWQRTPSKWITKTKVVRLDGTKPRFSQILGRTFSRLVPFEQLSFLVNKNPIGWHDRWPRTLVVPASYTPADVEKIDVRGGKKGPLSTFLIILIVVLVSISVLGILASIVLTSMNAAREKAKAAAEKARQEQSADIGSLQDQTLPVGSIGGQAYE